MIHGIARRNSVFSLQLTPPRLCIFRMFSAQNRTPVDCTPVWIQTAVLLSDQEMLAAHISSPRVTISPQTSFVEMGGADLSGSRYQKVTAKCTRDSLTGCFTPSTVNCLCRRRPPGPGEQSAVVCGWPILGFHDLIHYIRLHTVRRPDLPARQCSSLTPLRHRDVNVIVS